MFWAVTCEAQKRYYQVPSEPYHVSMASLEPREMAPSNRQVSLMVEHRGKEFLLCTLEYDRVMQVNLDLKFNKGEETYFFVNGDGTVHLSGYLLNKEPSDLEAAIFAQQIMEAQMRSKEQYNQDYGKTLDTKRLLTVDSSEEDSGEEFKPKNDTAFVCSKPSLRSDKHIDFGDFWEYGSGILPSEEEDEESCEDEESSDEDESSEDEYEDESNVDQNKESDEEESVKYEPVVDDDDDCQLIINGEAMNKKRKRSNELKKQIAKKKIALNEDFGEEQCPQLVSAESVEKKKKKKKKKKTIEIQQKANASDVSDDLANSSIGRTPMPKKMTSVSKDKIDASPSLKEDSVLGIASTSKSKFQKLQSSPKSEISFGKHSSGIEYKDLKVGDGPVAKPGKFAHVFYVGKCNNQVFDSRMKGLPFSFRLGRGEVIKGWDHGIEGMRVNGKRMLKIPPNLAYGKKGSPPHIPPNTVLFFTVSLVKLS